MNELVGPLADERGLLTPAVLVGLWVVTVGNHLAQLVGLPVPDKAVSAVAGVLLGVLAVYLGHVAWHAR